MKNTKYIMACMLALLVTVLAACKKESPLNADLSTCNVDNPVANTELDSWLKTNLLDPYNIETVYRYNRFYHGDNRDVAAVKTENVRPQMESVIAGFINPYKKVAGEAFIKRTVPKQFVLFGSGSYQDDDSMILGTAAGGIRITLYNVNSFNVADPNSHIGKIGIIHHEFTHILNQQVPMPQDFQNITKSTYNATWTKVSDATARANGYVTPYASSQPGEDFAEMVKVLLVNGQSWFDAWANGSTDVGKAALKAKEASVVQYFNVNLGIDFRTLQQTVQNVIRNDYHSKDAAFANWFAQNLYKTMTINLEDKTYADYGISAQFADAYNKYKAAVLAFNGTQKYHVDYIQLRFETATTMTVRAAFSNTAGNQYFGDYSFSYTTDAQTGETKFTKVANGTGTTFNNGALFAAAFTNTIQAYLTGKTFIASWMPANISADKFNSYAGFKDKAAADSYFYGLLGQTL